MEEKQLTHQESLNLIRTMLEQSRITVQHTTNLAELWIGLLGVIVSASVYLGWTLTHHPGIHLLWLLMFVSYGIAAYYKKRDTEPATYLSKAIEKAYGVMGWTFGLIGGAAGLYAGVTGTFYSSVFFPLSLILMSFVGWFKGLLLQEKIYIYPAYAVMLLGCVVLIDLLNLHYIRPLWILSFTLACILLWILPYLTIHYQQKGNA